jgi:hypothetical protein
MSIVATMIGELSHQTNPQREQGPNAPEAVMFVQHSSIVE